MTYQEQLGEKTVKDHYLNHVRTKASLPTKIHLRTESATLDWDQATGGNRMGQAEGQNAVCSKPRLSEWPSIEVRFYN